MHDSRIWQRVVSTKRLGIALVAFSLLSFVPLGFQAAQAAGNVETNVNISNSGEESETPAISAGGNRISTLWGERASKVFGTAAADIGQNPTTPVFLNTGTRVDIQFADVVVDKTGREHIAYAVGNNIFYRNRTPGGQWSNAIGVASDNFPNPIRIAVAPNGTLWIVWRDTDGTGIFFRFSDNNGAGWSRGEAGGVVAREDGNMFWPDVAVDQSNNPHVVWYLRSGGADKGEVKYADWDGKAFRSGKLTNDGSDLADQDPRIEIDGQNVQHMTWRKSLGDDWAIMYARRAPGQGWTNIGQVAQTSGNAGYSPGLGVDDAGSVYITYSTFYNSGSARRIVMVSKPAGQANWEAQNLTSGSWDSRTAVAGSSVTGLLAHVMIQQGNRGQDDDEIFYQRIRFGAAVATINADPLVNNDDPLTKSATETITFKNVTGDPKEIRWRWNAPPTDAASDSNGWQPYANPLTAPIPSTVPAGACATLTFYAQVRNGTAVDQTIGSDTILFDAAAQATVSAQNPKQSGNLQRWASGGAFSGDPRFTRDANYDLTVIDQGDCSKLRGYGIKATSGEQEITFSSDTASQTTKIPVLPATPGLVPDQTAFVVDKAGNRSEFPLTIYYDPYDGGAQGTANGAPVLATTINPTVTVSLANSLVRRLTFTNINVSDQVYGAVTNLPAGKQFWGVWIAVSKTRYAAADINTVTNPLQWSAIQVPSPDTTFTVDTSFATGQDGVALTGYAGTYYVYTKFLDGAGNPSTDTIISGPVTLAAGYTLPTLNTPFVVK